MFVFIIPEMRIYKGHWHNLQFRKLRQTSWFNGSLLNVFIGGYQLGKCISIPTRIYSFKDVSLFYMYWWNSSFRSTWDCTGMRSFKYQAQKYPKWSTIYVRRNSIVLLPFIVINQHMGLHRNAEFTCRAFRMPKVNLSGISLKRATNQNFIMFRNYKNWVAVKSDSFATSSSWLTHDMQWVIWFNKID